MSTAATAGIGLINPLSPSRGPAVEASADPSRASAWNQVVDELLRLRTLGPDWDGQGADAPDVRNIDAALQWVKRMQAWPQTLCPAKIAAGVAGEVHLVWLQGDLVLDAEVASPATVDWLLSAPPQVARQWKTDLAQTWLVGVLEDRA